MSEFALSGPELKKMVKIARKGPLPFAYNPGKETSEHYFALHRKRPAKALSKVAKSEGPGKKVAFGTCFVDGKVMQLTCEMVVPAMAKTLKRFLKANKVTLNVEILDADGNVVDADIEDLPDDPSLYDDDDDETVSEAPTPPSGGQDAAALVARVKAAQTALASAPGPVAEKLVPALKKAAELLRGQDLDAAAQTLDRIEAVLSKLPTGQAPSSDGGLADRLTAIKERIDELDGAAAEKLSAAFAKVEAAHKAGKAEAAASGAAQLEAALDKLGAKSEQTETAPPPDAPPPPDPQLIKLAQLVQSFKSQAGLLEDRAAGAEIVQALEAVGSAIKAGDKTAATAQLTTIRAQLEAAKAAQAAAKETPEEGSEDTNTPSPELIAWMRIQAQIEPQVNRALSEGLVEDVSLLRRNWSAVLGKVENGDYAGAEADLPGIQAMLDAGRSDGSTSHLADVPEDVRAFAVSSVNWRSTRAKMLSEVEKLEAAIRAAVGDDEDLDLSNSLSDRLKTLDVSLSDALDAIVSAPEGDDRDRARDAARSILGDFNTALSDPFFADVDNNSGFMSVSVASTARKALADIGKVLA